MWLDVSAYFPQYAPLAVTCRNGVARLLHRVIVNRCTIRAYSLDYEILSTSLHVFTLTFYTYYAKSLIALNAVSDLRNDGIPRNHLSSERICIQMAAMHCRSECLIASGHAYLT